MSLLDLVSVVLAVYLAVRLGDRLRLISWHTAKPLYVGLHLSQMLWALGVVHAVFETGLHWPQVFGIIALFCWLEVTRDRWTGGVPYEVTKPGHLGPPEFEPAMHRRKGDMQ